MAENQALALISYLDPSMHSKAQARWRMAYPTSIGKCKGASHHAIGHDIFVPS